MTSAAYAGFYYSADELECTAASGATDSEIGRIDHATTPTTAIRCRRSYVFYGVIGFNGASPERLDLRVDGERRRRRTTVTALVARGVCCRELRTEGAVEGRMRR